MEGKKSPKGRKRSVKATLAGTQPVTVSEDGSWDCSVCTFKNNAEAFKCSMCDVRKGTSTRKPRLNPDLVAAQQAQALTPPPFSVPESSTSLGSPIPSSSKNEEEEEETDPNLTPSPSGSKTGNKKPATSAKKSEGKKTQNKARLKNVDRSSATYHSVTVDDITVVITEFKPKAKKEKKEKISSPNTSSDNNEKTEDQGSTPIKEVKSDQDDSRARIDSKGPDIEGVKPNASGAGNGVMTANVTHQNVVNKPKAAENDLTDTSRSS